MPRTVYTASSGTGHGGNTTNWDATEYVEGLEAENTRLKTLGRSPIGTLYDLLNRYLRAGMECKTEKERLEARAKALGRLEAGLTVNDQHIEALESKLAALQKVADAKGERA